MYKLLVLFIVFHISLSLNSSSNGKSYFFKIGKNNNEFKVNNRIMFLNHNISDLEYSVVERKKNFQTFHGMDVPQPRFDFSLHLDKEWNYDHKVNTINKSHLPMFVKKMYDDVSATPNAKIITRILFNKNFSSPILKFKLDSINPDDTILDADLYFYWHLKNTSNIFKESVVLRLYQYEKQSYDYDENNTVQNPDVHKMFNVIYVSKAQKGWQMFKVKKPIDNWLNGEENLGLVLTISKYDSNELIEVFKDSNGGNFSTFIVVKSEANNTLREHEKNEISHATYSQDIFSQCQRQMWMINVQKMGWDKLIILPEEFYTYDCAGKCSISAENYINHAKLLHIFQKRNICCVPVRYGSLPIMFFDKFGDIAIKNYEKIIVTECGCR